MNLMNKTLKLLHKPHKILTFGDRYSMISVLFRTLPNNSVIFRARDLKFSPKILEKFQRKKFLEKKILENFQKKILKNWKKTKNVKMQKK